jgi:hypothetical protein
MKSIVAHTPESLSQFAVSRYILTAELSLSLTAEISSLRDEFARKYDCAAAAKLSSGIALARFEQYEMLEKRIIHRLNNLAIAQPSFLISLEDFGSLPSHSIYINITSLNQWVTLAKSIRPLQSMLTIDKERKLHIITEPHVLIAHKLLPWQYEQGWLELSNTHFAGKSMISKLVLLRRREGESHYRVLKKFDLLDCREEVKQGQLF